MLALKNLYELVRSIPRADAALVNELGRYGVATIHEAQGRKGLLAPRITLTTSVTPP